MIDVASLEFQSISPSFGVQVRGLDLSDDLSASVKERLREMWLKHGLLLFRDQQLNDEQADGVAAIFGRISNYGDLPAYVSNVVPDALNPNGELKFHHDICAHKEPLRGLMLYAYEAPPEGAGGETLFSNSKHAFELLPQPLRDRVRDLKVIHSTAVSDPNRRPRSSSLHPLAFPHPVTGEIVLFYSPRQFLWFVGLDPVESEALAEELGEYATRPEVVYTHVWRSGDLAVWDNLKLQHARTPFDPKYRRHLRRTQIAAP